MATQTIRLKHLAQTFALAAFAATAHAQSASAVSRYACPNSAGDLRVERSGGAARVTLGGHTYALTRKRSSIGDKFISSNAALIIDGESAVFVSEDHLNLGACTKSEPIAATE